MREVLLEVEFSHLASSTLSAPVSVTYLLHIAGTNQAFYICLVLLWLILLPLPPLPTVLNGRWLCTFSMWDMSLPYS